MRLIVYVITSHTRPDLVLRLVDRLRGPDAVVGVHHDPRGPALDGLGEAGGLAIPAAPVDWGHVSHLEAMLRCLRWALAHGGDWVVVLSGQDYPIRPVPAIQADLAAAEVDAFIEAVPVGPPVRRRGATDEFVRRYHYRWRRVPPALARLAARADPLLQAKTMPTGAYVGVPAWAPLPPYRGADWFSLSRRAAEAVLRAPEDVRRHYGRTPLPTEGFVQTVLANDPAMTLCRDPRRFMLWDPPPAAHPRVLGLADLDDALASGADFARKFDDHAVLDEIDRRVHRV